MGACHINSQNGMMRAMPVIKSAKKKMLQDKRRTTVNKVYRAKYRLALKEARVKKTKKSVQLAYQALDKAAKNSIIHKNKAARLKSNLIKLIKKSKKTAKKTSKK